MAERYRLALGVLLVLVLLASVPAAAQDFGFRPSHTVSLAANVSNNGVTGANCGTSTLNFAIGGSVISNNQSTCDGANFLEVGGALTLEPDGDIFGTIGGDVLDGHLLPHGHAFVAATTFNASVIGGFGLTAVVEPVAGVSFSQADLTGTWRMKAVRAGVPPANSTTSGGFGIITFDASGHVAPHPESNLTEFPSFAADTMYGGGLGIDSTGLISGLVITGTSAPPDFRSVNGIMAPDKNFVVGVTTIGPPASLNESGMFFLQRVITPFTYTQADLAGVWQFVGFQAQRADSGIGGWGLGTVALNSAGAFINGSFIDSFANVVSVTSGSLTLDSAGFITGSLTLSDGNSVFVEGTMFLDKHQIIGVGDASGASPERVGLFTLIKPGSLTPPPASTVQFHNATAKVVEGGTLAVQVDRSGSTTTSVTVDYAATAGTAAPGDFTPVSGTLTIGAGQTTTSLNLPTFGNSAVDGDRTVLLTLSNATNGATLGTRATETVTIQDDDSIVQFTQPTYTVNEGAGTATISLNRSGGLAFPAVVTFNATAGTAVAARDFTPVSTQVSFAVGQTSKTVSVPILNDTLVDGNRTVMLALVPVATRPPLGPSPGVALPGPLSSATLVITDNDQGGVVKLGSATYSGSEGTSVVVTISRSAVGSAALASNVSVPYATSSVNASAVAGVNYTPVASAVTFGAGETTKTVPLALLRDNVVTGPLTFGFTLGSPTGGGTLGSPASATVTVNNLDQGGVVVLSAKTYSVIENAGNVSVALTRSGGTAANASVLVTLSNGTAVAGTDYTDVTQRVTFRAGNTSAKVVIPILDNATVDGNRTFNVALSGAQGGLGVGNPASAVVTILDNESGVQFSAPSFTVKEGTTGTITVARTGALVVPATVQYNVSAGTALPGVDFVPASGTLSFAVNQPSATFPFVTINNTRVDGNRSATLRLGNPTGGMQLGPNASAGLTITDDDQGGRIALSSSAYSAPEGGTLLIPILRAAVGLGPLAGNVSVGYATVNGNASAGVNFVGANGSVTFAAGETVKTVPITLLKDGMVRGDLPFTFVLSNAIGGGSLGTPASAVVTVKNIDAGSPVVLSQSAYTIAAGAANVSIVVRRSGNVAANASVQFTTSDGTASIEGDYIGVNQRLFFGPNQTSATVVIPVRHSPVDRTFFVTLSAPQGVGLLGTPPMAVVTIAGTSAVIQFSGLLLNNLPEVVRSGDLSGNVSVNYYATSGTATLGVDFIVDPGTLVFGPGVTKRTIPVSIVNDNVVEGTEFFPIFLTSPSPGAVIGTNSSHVFEILDNDFGGTVNFANTSVTASVGQTVNLTLTRQGGLESVFPLNWMAVGGTAVPGVDFSPASGVVTFQPNVTAQSFAVTLAPSAQNKSVVFGFSFPPGGATAGPANTSTLFVRAAPVLSFNASTYTTLETAGTATVTVVRGGDSTPVVTVQYATSDGTATAGSDYNAASGTLTFASGQTTQTFAVPILTDRLLEPTETVNLTLSNPSGGNAMLGTAAATLQIQDVPPPSVSFSSATYTALEIATSKTITIVRSGDLSQVVTVDYAATDGTATGDADYMPTSGTATFAASQTLFTFQIPILYDGFNDQDGAETVLLSLGNVSANAVLGANASAVLSITDTVPQYVYVPNALDGTVTVFNAESGFSTLATIPVSSEPYAAAVTPDGSLVYVTNLGSDVVSIIDVANNTVVRNVIASFVEPADLVITPDGKYVYIGNSAGGTVSVLATSNSSVVTTIPLNPNLDRSPSGMAITPDGTSVYVAAQGTDTVEVIDTATNTVVADIAVGSHPDGIAINPAGTRAYVANAGTASNSVSVIDTASNTVVATVPVGDSPSGVVVSPDGSTVYVSNTGDGVSNGTVSVIDAATNTVTNTFTVVSPSAHGVALNVDGSRLFVTSGQSNGYVTVINTTEASVEGVIPVGGNPRRLAIGSFFGD